MFFPIIIVIFAFAAYSSDAGPVCPAKDGAYPVYIPHKDCTKFYECSNGIPYLFKCSPGLHFNPKINVCDWPWRATCKGIKN